MKRFKKTGILLIVALFIFGINISGIEAASVSELNQEIGERKRQIEKLDQDVEAIEGQIEETQGEAATLESQVGIISGKINQVEKEILQTSLEIEKTALEIQSVEQEINEKEKEIGSQQQVLSEFIKVMYEYDQKSPVEVLFSSDNFSDYLDQLQYLESLENRGKEILDDLTALKDELKWREQVLINKRDELVALNKKNVSQKQLLGEEKRSKENLLAETEEQEEKYQELLTKAKQEQESANSEIASLNREIERQIAARSNTNDNWSDVGGTGELAWPVVPVRGVSAYFMDSSYRSFFGVNHYAIDIPAPQGTPIHAPADGYVVKYRNAGYGYSYLVLYHGDGLTTVYGHVSAVYVSEGARVSRGETVAAVGGTPGTWGAGWMTTGPHLHFETRKNGAPQDPMNYLP